MQPASRPPAGVAAGLNTLAAGTGTTAAVAGTLVASKVMLPLAVGVATVAGVGYALRPVRRLAQVWAAARAKRTSASRTQTALRATLTKARPSLRQRFAIADDWQPEATAHRNGNRMNTTKFAAALAGGLTAGAIAVRLAAPASADTSGYVDALDSAGLIRP